MITEGGDDGQPKYIFYPSPNGLVCWNYKDHKQFILSGDHATRLIAIACNRSPVELENSIDRDLHSAMLIGLEFNDTEYWGWDPLSKIFHVGTKDVPIQNMPQNEQEWAEAYLSHCEKVLTTPAPIENYTQCRDLDYELPPVEQAGSFDILLSKRATSRSFLNHPVSLTHLSKLLMYALGFIPLREKKTSADIPDQFRKRRSSASGGGLNSTEGYVCINNVEGIARGVYYYNPAKHGLHLISEELPELGPLLAGQFFASNLAVGIFLTSRLDKLWWKYSHSRAYRMSLVEIGHIAQTFQLYACELGLGTWLTGALDDTAIERILKLENPSEQVMFFVGAGPTDGSDTPMTLSKLLSNENE